VALFGCGRKHRTGPSAACAPVFRITPRVRVAAVTMRGVIFRCKPGAARPTRAAQPDDTEISMKPACFSWIAILLAGAGCASDDAPPGSPDAAVLDAAAPDAIALDAAAPDALTPIACTERLLPAVADSVVLGSKPLGGNVDDIVSWEDGEEVQLVYGGQGSLMLVAEVVARGSGFTQEHLPFSLITSIGSGGEGVYRQPYQDPVFAADDGSWYWESVFVPFEVEFPSDGDVLDVSLSIGCFEIQRMVVARLPAQASPLAP
jgi:hypothetical protein